jgi:four helix bundle protein
MPKENILLNKSLHFAGRIVKLHKYLLRTHKESVISKQIVRSGTSIGANINEGNYGSSKADFIAKMKLIGEGRRFSPQLTGYSIFDCR